MSPKPRKKEKFPWVAALGWPLVIAPPILFLFVRTGDPRIDPMLRLGYGLPALAALLWAFTRLGDVRKYRKHVLAVLIVAALEFLGLFLYFSTTISRGPVPARTQPAPLRSRDG